MPEVTAAKELPGGQPRAPRSARRPGCPRRGPRLSGWRPPATLTPRPKAVRQLAERSGQTLRPGLAPGAGGGGPTSAASAAAALPGPLRAHARRGARRAGSPGARPGAARSRSRAAWRAGSGSRWPARCARRSPSSSGETKVSASPAPPRARCGPRGGCSPRATAGTSKFTTWLRRVDVDAARRDVGGHQHGTNPLLKPARACVRWAWLRLPWMRSARMPVAAEELREPVRAVLGAREREHAADARRARGGASSARLQLGRDRIGGVGDPGRRRRRALQVDRRGVAQDLARRAPRSAAAWWPRRTASGGCAGRCWRMRRMSGRKPMSSMRSASSSTSTSRPARRAYGRAGSGRAGGRAWRRGRRRRGAARAPAGPCRRRRRWRRP